MNIIKNIFPKKCILCGEQTFSNYPLCQNCDENFEIISGQVCGQCGLPLAGEENLCTKCRGCKFSFRTNRSLFLYRDLNRIAFHQYKFGKEVSLARFFAKSILLYIDYPVENTFFIPVPSSNRKRREKGWDQVFSVASIVEKKGGWPLLDCLGKLDCTQQKELDFEKRQKNLKGKFFMKKDIDLKGANCLLFDDVYTTGATIESCSGILKSYGAKRIDAITLFRD